VEVADSAEFLDKTGTLIKAQTSVYVKKEIIPLSQNQNNYEPRLKQAT